MRVNTTLYGELTLLTHCPLVGAVESMGFVTAISRSFNGTEDRQPLRDMPQQSISLSYVAMPSYFDVEYADIRKRWAIPFDQEIQYVGDVANGATVINCDTSLSDFRDNSLALLKNGSEFRVVEIEAVNPDSLDLLNQVSGIVNATISPLRVCVIDGDIGRSYNTTYQDSVVLFKVIDTTELPEQLPSQTYKGKDLYYPTLYTDNGRLETRIRRQQDLVDYSIGLFATRTRELNSNVLKNWNFQTDNRVELINFKKFLFRRLGMFREFYMPSFEQNMKLKNTGLVTNSIDVERTNYIERKNISLWVGSEWRSFEVLSTTQPNSTTTRLSLSQPVNEQASAIKRISYLGLYRLNSDSVDINYGGNGFATISMPIVELSG